jgi:YVTN family beta-propeller protein
VVDLSQQKVDSINLPHGAKPVAMGITSDGRFAFVTDAGLNQVHKIDVAQKTVVGSLSVGKRPMDVPVHPTQPFLYIPCMNAGAVYKVDINAWKVVKIIPVGKGAQGIAYAPGGGYAYVTLTWEQPNGRVAVIDTETDTVQTTFAVDKAPNGIAALFGKNQGW